MAKVWDVRQVTFSLCGLLIDAGFGEGQFIKATQAQAAFTAKEGCDGEVTRSRTNSKLRTFEVTLSPLSSSNTKLAVLHTLDKKKPGGAGVGPAILRDRNGLTLITGKGWVSKEPDVEIGKEAADKVWEITVEVDESFIGGA